MFVWFIDHYWSSPLECKLHTGRAFVVFITVIQAPRVIANSIQSISICWQIVRRLSIPTHHLITPESHLFALCTLGILYGLKGGKNERVSILPVKPKHWCGLKVISLCLSQSLLPIISALSLLYTLGIIIMILWLKTGCLVTRRHPPLTCVDPWTQSGPVTVSLCMCSLYFSGIGLNMMHSHIPRKLPQGSNNRN